MSEKKHTSDTALLKPVFEKSIDVFEKVLDGSPVTPQQLQVALTASQIYVKQKSVENQRALLVYSVARDYAQDKDELRTILQGSIPNVKFLKEKN